MSNMPQKQVTIQDIIQSDPRVVQLKKEYNELVQKRNALILDISFCESDIIRKMGQFEIVDPSLDVDLYSHLKSEFIKLSAQKHNLILTIAGGEKEMQKKQGEFEFLAEVIVDELKAQVGVGQQPQSGEFKPGEEEENHHCECNPDNHECCDECQGCTGNEKDIEPPLTSEPPTDQPQV